MSFKSIITYLFLLITPFISISQNCGTIQKNITINNENYYLLDDSSLSNMPAKLFEEINSNDTALVRLIIENGQKSEDYVDFFQRKGISIKKIGIKGFDSLPKDLVLLTTNEKRILRRYEKLSSKQTLLISHEKSTTFVNKKMAKPKFIKLLKRMNNSARYLLVLYPIYTYKNYNLIMYSINANRYGIPFMYEICKIE